MKLILIQTITRTHEVDIGDVDPEFINIPDYYDLIERQDTEWETQDTEFDFNIE